MSVDPQPRTIALCLLILLLGLSSCGSQGPATPTVPLAEAYPPPTSSYPPPPTLPLVTPAPETMAPTAVPPPTLTPVPTMPVLDWTDPAVLAARAPFREIAGEQGYRLWQITDNVPFGAASMKWSPEGKRLVVHPATDPGFEGAVSATLAILDLTGGAAWSPGIAYYSRSNPGYDWSPAGDEIAYLVDGEVWLADAEGQEALALGVPAGEAPLDPVFSPDGSLLALRTMKVEAGRAWYHVAVLDLAGQVVRHWTELPGGGRNRPVWSADGHQLAFTDYDEQTIESLWIGDVGSGTLQGVELGPFAGSSAPLPDPIWLAEDRAVLAMTPGQSQAWVVRVDGTVLHSWSYFPAPAMARVDGQARLLGGGRVELAIAPSRQYLWACINGKISFYDVRKNQEWTALETQGCHPPVWSPDGQRALIWGEQEEGIFLVEMETQAQTRVHDEESISWSNWSPDGTAIVHLVSLEGGEQLWLEEWPGGQERAISPVEEKIPWAAWLPDSTRLLYLQSTHDGDRFWLFDRASGAVEPITPVWPRQPGYQWEILQPLQWSPDSSRFAFLAQVEGRWEGFVVEVSE